MCKCNLHGFPKQHLFILCLDGDGDGDRNRMAREEQAKEDKEEKKKRTRQDCSLTINSAKTVIIKL